MTVTVSGTKLLVAGNQVGSALITVTATDFDGAMVSDFFTVNVIAPPGRSVNLATRMQVGTGDNALIAGFIMQGSTPKRLLVRALGPSLTQLGVPNAMADPVLELRDNTGALLATNDNWGDAANRQDVLDYAGSGFAANRRSCDGSLQRQQPTPRSCGHEQLRVVVVDVYDLDSGPSSTLLTI